MTGVKERDAVSPAEQSLSGGDREDQTRYECYARTESDEPPAATSRGFYVDAVGVGVLYVDVGRGEPPLARG